MVGKIENGVLVEFGNHWNTAVSSGRSYVLSEGIAISTGGGLWNGGFQNIIGAWGGEVIVLPIKDFGFHGACHFTLIIPIIQHIAHIVCDVLVDGV